MQRTPLSKGRAPVPRPAASHGGVNTTALRGAALRLQAALGNQATARLLRAQVAEARIEISGPQDAEEREAEQVAGEVVRMPEPGVAESSLAPAAPVQRACATCGGEAAHGSSGSPHPVQAKLEVSDPGDALEIEAERVADEVMRMPEPGAAVPPPMGRSGERVDRACAACTAQDELQRTASDMPGEAVVPQIVHDVLGSPGRPLAPATRAFMEPRFGRDFGNVRIHDDARAGASARAVNALAYTHGSDIVFDAGRYAPDTDAGKHLLAHELTHTIQQGFAPALAGPSPDAPGGGPDASIARIAVVQRAAKIDQIQRSCGREEIGTPAGCTGSSMVVPERPRYLFQTSCDEFLTGNELDLRTDARSIQQGETVEVHGLASEEGPVDFNIPLSCARALRASAVIEDVLAARGITARILVFSHGPQTSGPRTADRAVAIIRRSPTPEPEPEPTPPACGGLYSDGNSETADPDHDLDQVHHAGEVSPDVWFYDHIGGESGALTDFRVGFFGGTIAESTSDDDTLFDHFVSGSGGRLDFATPSDMARIIGGASAFTTFADGFERALNSHIATTGTLCGFDGDTYIRAHRPGYFHDPLFAWAVMGGYSRIEARVSQTASGVTVRYKIYDHFGAGVTDASSYLLGLSAMYYLQHFHGVPGRAYTPFIWSVEIQRTSP